MWRKLRFWFRRDRLERELDEELRFHIEMSIEARVRAGLDLQAARQAARRRFGNTTLLREESREIWGIRWIDALFGLAPALDATRVSLTSALKNEGTLFGDRLRPSRLQGVLVVFQVAVCAVFLVGAALLLRGVAAAYALDPGFEVKNLLVASIDLPEMGYDGAAAAAFRRRVVERLEALPQVKSVALAFNAPLGRSSSIGTLELEGWPAGRSAPRVRYNAVSQGYFATVGIPIVRGRVFTDREGRGDHLPAVVSETMARRFWPSQEALGKTFRLASSTFEIVGIARDARSVSLSESDATYFYKPTEADRQSGKMLLVRTSGDAGAVSAGLRGVVTELDPKVSFTVRSLQEIVEQSLQQSRVLTTAVGILGLLALTLAAVGISGLVAFAVSLRTREIGIRMALGAHRSSVLGLVLRQGMRPVLVGLAIGLVLSAAASRLLVGILYGLSPLDPIAFLGGTLFLVTSAVVAAYLPARRAMRADPLAALRHE
jgi:predicted permease